MILQDLLSFFKRWSGTDPQTTNREQAENNDYVEKYADITNVNITAWAANRLANMTLADSDITIVGKSSRAKSMSDALQTCTSRLKKIVTRSLSVGGIVLKPYVRNGRLYTDVLPQNRFINIEQIGDIITAAGFVAETFTKGNKMYARLEFHTLKNGIYTIEQRAIENDKDISLSSVPRWANLKPTIIFSGVEQMLFSVITCPIDSRGKMNNVYGVPITYGQDKLVSEIVELLNEFQREFVSKGAFIGVSSLLLDGRNRLPADAIYRKFKTDNDDFFEVFSPDIRAQAYIDGINYYSGGQIPGDA